MNVLPKPRLDMTTGRVAGLVTLEALHLDDVVANRHCCEKMESSGALFNGSSLAIEAIFWRRTRKKFTEKVYHFYYQLRRLNVACVIVILAIC